MNLFQLQGNLLQVLELAESAEPDDKQLFEDTIQSLKDGIEDKGEGYAKVIKQLTADEKQLKDKINTDQARLHSLQNNISRLKNSLLEAMELSNINKIKGVDITARIQSNPPKILVLDETTIPQEFKTTKTSTFIDKKSILNAFKDHNLIPGAKMIQDKSLRIK
ncbi:siphovirus Gp157 family protein [Lactobacillus acetotolerans]|uniref:siphovirus Gp157 family protein n=1 Tax=Lactobacillus acetotolerans TaxID=1600 RepID=UPI002FD96DEC